MPGLRRQPPLIGLMTLAGTVDDGVALNTFHLLRKLLTARREVAGLVVRVASHGGSLAAAQAVVEQLAQLRAETSAAVVTVVDDIAASAAFFVALHGDRIYAQPAALLGSVGTLSRGFDISGVLATLGVRDLSIASSPHKTALDTIQTRSDAAGGAAAAAVVADVHAQFVEAVRRCRQAPVSSDLLDGRMFTGRQAQAAGLVDELGGTTAAVAQVVRERGLVDFELMQLESGAKFDPLAMLFANLPFGRFLARLFGAGR